MPQNPTQVLVGLSGGAPKALATDAAGKLTPGFAAVTPDVTTAAIAVTNTFQNVWAANTDRAPGGSITNNGSNVMQVFFGASGATAAKAVDLAGGATLYLANVFGPNQVFTGVVQITGTAADTYAAVELERTA